MPPTRVLFVPVRDDPEKPKFDPRAARPAVDRDATPVWKVPLALAGQFVRFVARAGRPVAAPATAGFGAATWVTDESCAARVGAAGAPESDHLLVLYRAGGRAVLVVGPTDVRPLGPAAEQAAFWRSAAADASLSSV